MTRLNAWISLLALVAGCASQKKPVPPLTLPPATASVGYRAGPALAAMPTTRPAGAISPGDALIARVQWIGLENLPSDLPPLLQRARLIATESGANPLLPAGQLTRSAKLIPSARLREFESNLSAGKFGRQIAIADTRGALPHDVTAAFHFVSSESVGLLEGRARVEVDIYRPPTTRPTIRGSAPLESLHYSIIIERPPRRERAVLDADPAHLPARFGVIVPEGPGDGGEDSPGATLAMITIMPADQSAEHRAEVAQCQRELSQAALAATRPSGAPRGAGEWRSLLAGTFEARTRPALVYLATQTGASLCGEVALVADETTLSQLFDRITKRTGGAVSPIDKSQLGWQLDASAMELLATVQSAEKMSKELDGVLSAYAGEAGRNPSSVDEMLRSLSSRQELDARMIAENFNYLEDISPAARVRAYDWLSARGKAPAGYDPLGPVKERRAAVDRAISAAGSITSSTTALGGVP